MPVRADSLIQQLATDSVYLSDSLSRFSALPFDGELDHAFINTAGVTSALLPAPQSSWPFFLVFGLLTAFVITRTFLGNLHISTFHATIRYNSAISMFKDNSLVQRQKENALDAFYFLSVGLYLSILFNRFEILPYGLSGFKLLLFNVGILAAWFYLRKSILGIVGHVFYTNDLFREYIYHSYSYNKLMGITFLPVNLILLYTAGTLNEVMIFISLFLLFIIIIMKMTRGIIFSLKHRVFNFYLFLYLCALEIVPFLLIYKWFISIV